MAQLSVIGEPFADFDAALHRCAARDLADAVGITAPRGFSGRLLIANDSPVPHLESPRASVELIAAPAASLPRLWRSSLTARPLDGEFVHAVTPLAALRAHNEYDGSQNTVMVPHTLAWDAPELLGEKSTKAYITFVERALDLADAVVAPTHAVALKLHELYEAEVQVMPLAAPSKLTSGVGSAEAFEAAARTRKQLGIADRFIATTAWPGEHGRLEWLIDAMRADDSLPDLVVLRPGSGLAGAADPEDINATAEIISAKTPITAKLRLPFVGKTPLEARGLPEVVVADDLAERVKVVQCDDLDTMGHLLAGATLLAMPQAHTGAAYEVLGAIANRVPVLHAGNPVIAELAFEAGVQADTAESFAAELGRLSGESGSASLQQLCLFADDRAHMLSWQQTALQLWELHANI